MSKSARIERARLQGMEQEFEALLRPCLVQCSEGRWGLFGQNAHLDPEDRYWTWPEAKQLRTLAAEIQALRLEGGDGNPLCDKFLALCRLKDPNAQGEPKLAARLLAEIEAS
jgi:hypothetical protein